jgi:signal transduction histidine kinase
MQPHPEPGEQRFAQQRTIAALTGLSALALQTSMLRFSTPEATDHQIVVLLNQLVAICEAQQGAFFLLRHSQQISGVEHDSKALLPSPALSLLARVRMSMEEAQQARTSAVPIPAGSVAGSEALPQTMYWTRSLDTTFAPLPHMDEAALPGVFPCSVVLLFTWPQVSEPLQQEAQQQAIQLLPMLANLVDTILVHILMASHEGDQPGKIFPAELLATVGHEFRGPLTTIQGYATTLLRHDQRLAAEERQDFLRAISEAGTHLGKLVERFLELTQLEARVHALAWVPVNLLALVQEALNAIKKNRTHRFVLVSSLIQSETLEQDEPGEIFHEEVTLSGDRRLLRIMLDMLLENAVIYSEPESLVEVSLEPITAEAAFAAWQTPAPPGTHQALILPARFEPGEPLIVMRVRDHGIGIDHQHLTQIFRRFYRVDTRLTRDVNGLGLGLALCKTIVELHRGMLWVESAVGEGSTFALILPRGFLPEFQSKSIEA